MLGGRASSRSQKALASSGGAIGSSRATSPRDSTQVEATSGFQACRGVQSGWARRHSQRPGATSRGSTLTGAAVGAEQPAAQRAEEQPPPGATSGPLFGPAGSGRVVGVERGRIRTCVRNGWERADARAGAPRPAVT